MKCLLLFYSGTNNTTYLTNILKKRLEEKGVAVDTCRINPLRIEQLDYSSYDLLGVGYPIYGFNVPVTVDKFIRKQRFPKGLKTFIYKNSGETLRANDASSLMLYRKLKRDGAIIKNEYHFVMPYNIHFRFDEHLVKEMLDMDEMLLDILVKEVLDGISNIKRYKLLDKLVNYPLRLTYIGGNINVLFYRVKKDKCIKCGKCVNGCQSKNVYFDKKGNVRFHSRCNMCMNCTLNCPTDAIRMGLFDGWRVNKPYDFESIGKLENEKPIINENTTGFFKCYKKTFSQIKKRHIELFKK